MGVIVCEPTVTAQVVALADHYAEQFVSALDATISGQVLATRDSLRKAVAGILISFLTETLMTVQIDERYAGLDREPAASGHG
jgi:hypothetical protein